MRNGSRAGRRALVAALALGLLGGAELGTPAAAPAAPAAGTFESFPVPIAAAGGGIEAIAWDGHGSLWFVANGAVLAGVATIGRMNAAGEVTAEYNIPTGAQPDEPEASDPRELALGPEGDMWFTDDGVNKENENLIGRIGPTGRVTEFPIPNPPLASASEPDGIALGPEGDMWFTEADRGAIGRIAPNGQFTGEFPLVGGGTPTAIALGPEGNMWFTSAGAVGKITPAGENEQFPFPGEVEGRHAIARAITRGPEGDMWFTGNTFLVVRSYVERIDPATDKIVPFPLLGTAGDPSLTPNFIGGIVAGPDGNLWFPYGSALQRITPEGDLRGFPAEAVTTDDLSALQMGSVALGPEGGIWVADPQLTETSETRVAHILRFTVPVRPVNLEAPTLAGAASEGQVLTASAGVWANDPSEITYQWQICAAAGDMCSSLPGETAATHLVSAADVGHTLRVVVTASGGGESTEADSAVSGVVVGIPGAPVTRPLSKTVRLPLIPTTMIWKFAWSRRYTVIESLVVEGLPRGAVLEVECRGRGCAFAKRRVAVAGGGGTGGHAGRCAAAKRRCRTPGARSGVVGLTGLFKSRRLGVGARITVAIERDGWIGKSYRFTTRADRTPRVERGCLSPGFGGSPRAC